MDRRGLKPDFFLRTLRGAEAPLFHGTPRQSSRFLHCAAPFGFAQGPAPVGMTNFWWAPGYLFLLGRSKGQASR
jgi:hypothetical protein